MQGFPSTFSQTQKEETGSEEKFENQNETKYELTSERLGTPADPQKQIPSTTDSRVVFMTSCQGDWKLSWQGREEMALYTALKPQLLWLPLARTEHYQDSL